MYLGTDRLKTLQQLRKYEMTLLFICQENQHQKNTFPRTHLKSNQLDQTYLLTKFQGIHYLKKHKLISRFKHSMFFS